MIILNVADTRFKSPNYQIPINTYSDVNIHSTRVSLTCCRLPDAARDNLLS